MADGMRIGLISFGAAEFATLHETCAVAGHEPVVYAFSRSMRPRKPTDEGAARVAGEITAALPTGVNLLLPGSSEGLGASLHGYGLDLLVCYGFSWRLPRSVLQIPRYGVLNIHSSLLPKYRGPAPVLWAIRNGDPDLGVTVHRMDEEFDTGPVLAQQGGVPLPDDVTPTCQDSRCSRKSAPAQETTCPAAVRRTSRRPGPTPSERRKRSRCYRCACWADRVGQPTSLPACAQPGHVPAGGQAW